VRFENIEIVIINKGEPPSFEEELARDVNAALNLAALAASSAVTACGEPRSGVGRKPRVKRGAAKQEEKTVILEAA
jgi:hypothetical protein